MALASWYNDTVTLARVSGVGASGDRTYATATTIKARVELGSKRVYNAQGNETQCEAVIFTSSEVRYNDHLWLPGDDTGGEPRLPISVIKVSDKAGTMTLYEVAM